jgi:hypothetical protein
MFSLQLEQLARQHHSERPRMPAGLTAAVRRPARRVRGRAIRTHTGWLLIAIGLRLAESGSR